MSHQKFLEAVWAHRDRLKCSTIVVRAGAGKWVCAVCVEPHDIQSPKRQYLRDWYKRRGKFQRIAWRNAGLCTNCGKALEESPSTVYCVQSTSASLP